MGRKVALVLTIIAGIWAAVEIAQAETAKHPIVDALAALSVRGANRN